MISQRLAKSGIVMALVLATGATGNAQSVVAIREGTFTVDDTRNNSMSVSGTQGFRFDGSFSLARAQYEAIEQCWLPECAPGTVVDLSDSWVGGDIFGTAQFRGKTYPGVGCGSCDGSLFLAFSASVTMPPISDQPVILTVPFDFAGVFSFGLNGPRPDSVPLTGGGTATVTLVPLAEDPNFWHIERVVFEFTPLNSR
jgi:hypothetical protein